ncbi:MAG TPA: FAD-dependent monooxygenase [Ramlibacter sp.]|nr:FAD-dependent monooxygenase [Ramlibacter sp.]
MSGQLLIAGGGIGGLAAAVAARRAGWEARVFEQAPAFSEVGAGLQLGPNATRVLRAWGLLEAARPLACAPQRLVARDAGSGAEIAALPLGEAFELRYGAPYLTLHRADLHQVLLQAAQDGGAMLHTGVRIDGFEDVGEAVRLRLGACADQPEGDALAAADGLWSVLRQQLLNDGAAVASDHVALRGMAQVADLPARWRVPEVTAWLGPRLHLVTYPVQGGRMLNIVCVAQQATQGDRTGWDHTAAAESLRSVTAGAWGGLQELLQAVPSWGQWVLHDRPVVAGAQQMARGRVALLGDAAHPMRPYLAQGAAMALEDAFELGRALSPVDGAVIDVPTALRRYALNRWERSARVQRRSLRNADIFHATGALRLARDVAMRSLGGRLMDLPWLYG